MSIRKNSADPLAIIPRDQHSVSRKSISEAALKVLSRLDKAGYRACLVGGGVRDLLLNQSPKDFDVATDATPEQIHELFRNSRIIGRRFRLVHIRFGREIIEVATFRGHSDESPRTELNTEGRILRDNTFGEIEEDAIRRDFTINALYYDISDFSILDYADGMADIQSGTLRMIGDAMTRYQEDPVRMLRAIRFASKLNFVIEESTAAAIFDCGPLLDSIPPARLFDEVVKLFHCGNATRTLELLRHFQLLAYLLPALNTWLENDPDESMLDFIDQALINTDSRINTQQHVSPAFIFAVLLWPVVHQQAKLHQSNKMKIIPAITLASTDVMEKQVKRISMPRRYSQMCRNIWSAQPRFQRTQGNYPMRLLGFPNFRAAYDFMCIQSIVGLMPKETCEWWTEFQLTHQPEEPQRNKDRDNQRRQSSKAGNNKRDRNRHAL